MKLHDDLINEVEPHETIDDAVKALLLGIADRIEACHGNAVRLSDLVSVLREDPAKIGKAVAANTPNATEKVRTTSYDAPSPAFDKPRDDVKPGMFDAMNDHRDQVSPENENTEVERERIRREQVARDRGQAIVVEEKLPA